jgi:glycosyltransferase involved in cell wall biosynthesis
VSLSARVADYIVVDSESSDADLVAHFPSVRGRSSVVYNGCDFSRFDPVDGASTMDGTPVWQPYFLYVGVMSPTKNLARLIEAFARFKKRDERGFSLVLAGRECGNHMASTLLPLIRALGVESWVKWVGFVSDPELGRLYRNACALAMPSLGEGFGYPLVEAMGMGVPLLTSNVSSCPEVAGDAGICVDPLSVDAIAQALLRLATDEPERQRLIARGQARCRLFTVERMAAGYLALIERLASGRPRRGPR